MNEPSRMEAIREIASRWGHEDHAFSPYRCEEIGREIAGRMPGADVEDVTSAVEGELALRAPDTADSWRPIDDDHDDERWADYQRSLDEGNVL